MKHHLKAASVLVLPLALMLTPVSAQDTGSADFTRYVALGDSLTAGYSNNSLIYTHQAASLGRLLALQAGAGNTFEQPWVDAPGLPNELYLYSLTDPLLIAEGPGEIVWPAWDFDLEDPQPGSFLNFYLGQPIGYLPYDNLGIPGMGAEDAISVTCDGPVESPAASPFYCTVLRNPECEPVFDNPAGGICGAPTEDSRTALEQALYSDDDLGISPPTFMTVWIGPADVLLAVTSGLVIPDVTITTVAEFSSAYPTIIQEISDAEVQMAIANVPDATNTPWVTTIPPFVVDPVTGEPVLDAQDQPIFLLGTTGTGAQRSLTLADRVILPASALLSQGMGIPTDLGGTGQYLPDNVILDDVELGTITSRIDSFNALIATEAQDAGAAFVDAYTLMNDVTQNGVLLGGVTFTTDFLTGGLYGYDGLHPTNLGYGIVTQWFVDAINQHYGGSIPPVDLGPLVFGSIPGGSSLGGSILGAQTQNAMLASMGSPDVEKLQEIKRRMQRDRSAPHQQRARDRRELPDRRDRGGR
jgi:lysophospholipase L1-like esterase